jgi:hypothetical protein
MAEGQARLPRFPRFEGAGEGLHMIYSDLTAILRDDHWPLE